MTTTPVIDQRLRDLRCTRARCAASLRCALMGLPQPAGPEDRRRALQIEREAAEAALAALLVPAVIPEPMLSGLDREAWVAAQAALREGAELPRRVRIKLHRLPSEQGLEQVVEQPEVSPRTRPPVAELPKPLWEEPLPEPTPMPEPAPVLTGWRAARRRRLLAAGVA